MENGISIDESRAPLVLVTYPDEITAEKLRSAFEHYADIAKRGLRVAYLIDFCNVNPVKAPASVRHAAAECFKAHREALVASTICEGRVVRNALARGVLTGFDWLTTGKWPCANFATRQEAEGWIEKKLTAMGLSVPSVRKTG